MINTVQGPGTIKIATQNTKSVALTIRLRLTKQTLLKDTTCQHFTFQLGPIIDYSFKYDPESLTYMRKKLSILTEAKMNDGIVYFVADLVYIYINKLLKQNKLFTS